MRLDGKKIFCVGFQKTGTTSLTRALRGLGFTVGSAVRPIKQQAVPGAGDPTELIHAIVQDVLTQADAIQDSPCPFLYQEFDRWYPGSKFILTIRPTEGWLQSYAGYFGENNNVLRRWMYDVDAFKGNEDHYRATYEGQNEAIRRYFADRPDDLLVLDLTKGDGWLKLVNFLGPDFLPPFPHFNKGGEERKEMVEQRQRKRERRQAAAA